MEFRNYQINAIQQLHNRTEYMLHSDESSICILQAPTGSGKTVIMAEFLRELVRTKNVRNLSFIWISVRKLHGQSKDKLENMYRNDGAMQCSYYNDLDSNVIEENEILFLNWDSVNRFDNNIIMKDNEHGNNLLNIIQNTKNEGRSIILIIDESHHTAGSEISTTLIKYISPRVTFMISATPSQMSGTQERVNVNLNDVKADGMIKNEVVVNPLFGELSINGDTVTKTVIVEALKKRQELENMYREENSNVVPLVLIQLPDRRNKGNDIREKVETILRNLDITEDNDRLAIWLSDEKSNTLKNIEENDNGVHVLIFKQAISLGWDCPRASILVALRELKDYVFTIQTVGRIMRMPEHRHYTEHYDLNRGYVFTNLETISVTENMIDYVGQQHTKRNEEYEPMQINSTYINSSGIRPALGSRFKELFKQEASDMKLKDKIDTNPHPLTRSMITDGKIIDSDRIGNIEHDNSNVTITDEEVQELLEKRVAEWCVGFPVNGSSGVIKSTLYRFLTEKMEIGDHSRRAQEIILYQKNLEEFTKCVTASREKYGIEPVGDATASQVRWDVPETDSYGGSYKKFVEDNKSIMKPLYVRNNTSVIEIEFMKLLSDSENVKWWYKNGDSGKKYFSVQYAKNNTMHMFYIDFIVKLNNGKIGLFDTKDGITAQTAGPRANGLYSYINRETGKINKFIGGIVITRGGAWFYHDGNEYSYSDTSLDGWNPLGSII